MKLAPFSVDKIWIPTDFAEFGIQHDAIYNLAGCENSEPSALVLEALRDLQPEYIVDHWNSQDKTLRRELADLHNVYPEQILLTPGAMGAIRYCFDVFIRKSTKVGLLQPDFPGFSYYAQHAEAAISYSASTTFPFSQTIDDVKRFLTDSNIEALCLSNPNACTGTAFNKLEIEELIGLTETLFVVDEADALNVKSVASLTNNHDNILVIRSFSKFYGLSGLRIGYLVSPKVYVEDFERTVNPIDLTSISILAAQTVLKDFEYQKKTQDRVLKNKMLLHAACNGTPFHLVPGSECFASYVWSDEGEEDPYDFFARSGIKIAKGDAFGISKGGRINLSNSDNVQRMSDTIRYFYRGNL